MPDARLLACSLLIGIAGLACASSRSILTPAEPRGLATYLKAHSVRDLKVTPDSGPSVWLHDPVVMGDSVIGDAGRDNPPARRAYLVARIQRLQTGETSAGKTIGLVAIVALVAIAGLLVLAATSVEKIE